MPVKGIGQEGIMANIFIREIKHNIRIGKLALDLFPNLPIIGRNTLSPMSFIFSLSLIVIVLAVLIIKDLVSVRMATVRVKK